MKSRLWLVSLIFAAHTVCLGQVKIDNPRNLPVPKEKVETLLATVQRVVSEEFDIRQKSSQRFPLTLVMGAEDERYDADDERKIYTIYLASWDETKFTAAATALAVYRLVIPQDRRKRMVTEALRRSDSLSPVHVHELRR
jgi:hypothetical protein